MTIQQHIEQGIQFIPSVVGYLIDNDNVLLGLRKKVSLGLGENLIAGIGGKLEDEETDEQALYREIEEEIKVQVASCTYRGRVSFIFPHKPKWNQTVGIYLINTWRGEPQETDVIKPIWFAKDALPTQQMWDDNMYWLPMVLTNNKVEGIFLHNEDGKVIEHTLREI